MKYWETNSILNNQTEKTPPREIFQAVCDSIGEHFETKNFKYSRSIPKITRKENDYKLEIRFHSSSSNYAGGYVNLEINSFLYSLKLGKTDKSKSKHKGLITGVMTPLSKTLPPNFNNTSKVVENIEGKITQHPVDKFHNKEYVYNRNVNVYGIDIELFERIINFIELRILSWYDKFKMDDELLNLISEMGGGAKYSINKDSFYKYLELRDIKNISEIQKLINSEI